MHCEDRVQDREEGRREWGGGVGGERILGVTKKVKEDPGDGGALDWCRHRIFEGAD